MMSCKRDAHLDPADLVDPRDGQRYATVMLDDQLWMASNLNYNLDGSLYNSNNPHGGYGRLYTFEQAQVACPDGWHLPTDREWQWMEYRMGLEGHELGKLGYRGERIGRNFKSKEGWILGGGYNTVGFNAYPAGQFDAAKNAFIELGHATKFWTASDSMPTSAWYRGFTKEYHGIYRYWTNKDERHSCRCIKDQ